MGGGGGIDPATTGQPAEQAEATHLNAHAELAPCTPDEGTCGGGRGEAEVRDTVSPIHVHTGIRGVAALRKHVDLLDHVSNVGAERSKHDGEGPVGRLNSSKCSVVSFF